MEYRQARRGFLAPNSVSAAPLAVSDPSTGSDGHGDGREPPVAARSQLAAGFLDRLKDALLDGSAPLYIAGLDGTILYANESLVRIAGALAESGQPIDTEFVGTVAAIGEPLLQAHTVRLDNRDRRYQSEHSLVRDSAGRPLAVIGRFTPTDDLTSARDSADLARERFEDITRLVSDWVWETDRNLCLTYVSRRVLDALGHHPKELLTTRLADLVPDAGHAEQLTGALATRRPFRGIEVSFRTHEGQSRVFQLGGLPIYGQHDGAFAGFRGVAQDVTELAMREAALNQAVDAAEAANRAKSEFLANMSHELRTPLNAIIGFSEIMKTERFGPIGSSRYRAYLDDVFESAHHLLTLINDVLDVAKIEAGRLELFETEVCPDKLIDSVVRLVAERAERGRIRLSKAVRPNLPRIIVDERKLKQILLNLLSNAIKFTPDGGKVEISASYESGGPFRFAVKDTGIGMRREDLAVALSPFGQVDGQLSRKFEGTGLGLPLSKALAELHGGDLRFETAPGRGTTVTLWLPAGRLVRGTP